MKQVNNLLKRMNQVNNLLKRMKRVNNLLKRMKQVNNLLTLVDADDDRLLFADIVACDVDYKMGAHRLIIIITTLTCCGLIACLPSIEYFE